MQSAYDDEVLGFIRDFETSSREYLLSKGLSENEMTSAYLELQWNFLHTILKQHAIRNRKTYLNFYLRSN